MEKDALLQSIPKTKMTINNQRHLSTNQQCYRASAINLRVDKIKLGAKVFPKSVIIFEAELKSNRPQMDLFRNLSNTSPKNFLKCQQ